jgi:integrase/recombinase XerD
MTSTLSVPISFLARRSRWRLQALDWESTGTGPEVVFRQTEVVFVPQKLAHRLGEYIRQRGAEPKERIFSISYPAARIVVKKAGELVGISLKPHDLRRHAVTYASKAGTPIEIASKVILRHANLGTTQRYLGKVTDLEAMRWIESLHG